MNKPKDEKLCKAVEDFTRAMLNRLSEKEREGYTGWDSAMSITDHGLACSLEDDADELLYRIRQGGGVSTTTAVDIANRAMMLWYRAISLLAQMKKEG